MWNVVQSKGEGRLLEHWMPYGLVAADNMIFELEWRRLRTLRTEASVQKYNRWVTIGCIAVVILWWPIRLSSSVIIEILPYFASFVLMLLSGEIMTRVTSDTEHVERIFVDGLEGLLTASLTLVGITIMMFVLNWKLALLSLLPIPILVVCAAWFTRRVHGYYGEIRKSVANLNAYLQDALSGIKETIGFNQHA